MGERYEKEFPRRVQQDCNVSRWSINLVKLIRAYLELKYQRSRSGMKNKKVNMRKKKKGFKQSYSSSNSRIRTMGCMEVVRQGREHGNICSVHRKRKPQGKGIRSFLVANAFVVSGNDDWLNGMILVVSFINRCSFSNILAVWEVQVQVQGVRFGWLWGTRGILLDPSSLTLHPTPAPGQHCSSRQERL